MIDLMDIDTYKWLLTQPHFKGSLSVEEILYALVTCALAVDSAAPLPSSKKSTKPYHEAAALIVQAIRVLEAPQAMRPVEEWSVTTTLNFDGRGNPTPIRDDDVEIED